MTNGRVWYNFDCISKSGVIISILESTQKVWSTLSSWANVLLESIEHAWYVKVNKNINIIKQLAFFYVEHGVFVKLLT
jgi:hypothetical protein